MQNLKATTSEVVHLKTLWSVHYKPLQEVHSIRYSHILASPGLLETVVSLIYIFRHTPLFCNHCKDNEIPLMRQLHNETKVPPFLVDSFPELPSFRSLSPVEDPSEEGFVDYEDVREGLIEPIGPALLIEGSIELPLAIIVPEKLPEGRVEVLFHIKKYL